MEHDYLARAASIEAFDFDEATVVDTFSRRLARENGWSATYTQRVVREYKRFLILALTARHVVSPSESVDQAWHLHVLHAARYRRFCADVLGRQLDHGPSDGGSAEREHFVRAYEQTLSSYEQRFGVPPPCDVWPNAQRRFGADLAVRRVNVAEHWVVRKPRVWRWLLAARSSSNGAAQRAMGWLAVFSVFACGCGASLSGHARGPSYLRGFLLLWATTLGIAYLCKRLSSRATSSDPPELEPYALAHLVGGPALALDSAIATLTARGCFELDSDGRTLIATRPVPRDAPAFEHDVHGQVASAGRLGLRELQQRATMLGQGIAQQLLKAELIVPHPSKLPLLLALVAPVIGTFRILTRLGSDKPISLLVLLTALATALAFWLFRPRRGRTRLGEAAVARARAVHEPLQGDSTASALAESGTLPIMFALFGGAAIIGLPAWASLFDRRTASYDSSGCGTACGGGGDGGCGGDGGGGCGGGCGGCGGGGGD